MLSLHQSAPPHPAAAKTRPRFSSASVHHLPARHQSSLQFAVYVSPRPELASPRPLSSSARYNVSPSKPSARYFILVRFCRSPFFPPVPVSTLCSSLVRLL
ncbi:hypothetical protein BKA80DRAFT_269690 [Phyllosticta citrichinensis]